ESDQVSEDELNSQTDNQESDDDEDFNKEYLLSDNELIKEIENKISNNKLPASLK
ncbi:13304_t:CDS:1, partial [Funneliformis caledonium]